MKKIIAGRKYDTDTAKLVGESESGYPGDFDYEVETLYRKRNGEYFLHGVGNAASRYAKSAGQNTWGRGEKIIPLSYDAARKFAEEQLTTEEYEAEFGTPEEGTEALNLTISSTAAAAIRQRARQEGITIAALVEWMASTI